MDENFFDTLIQIASRREITCVSNNRTDSIPSISFAQDLEHGEGELRRIDDSASRCLTEKAILRGIAYLNNSASNVLKLQSIGSKKLLVERMELSELSDPRKIVSASSPGRPGTIWISANWYSQTPRRIAGNILHEAFHQLLYLREETGEKVVRNNSIAYSPWKGLERPGWAVWHSFWTFSGHCVYLADTISKLDRQYQEDLLEVSIMYLRLVQCYESIKTFRVVVDIDEMQAIDQAMSLVVDRFNIKDKNDIAWGEEITLQRPKIVSEFNKWGAKIISKFSMSQ